MLDSVRDAAAAIDVVEQPLACGAEGNNQDVVCEAPLSPTTPPRESRSSSRGDAKCSIDLAHLQPFFIASKSELYCPPRPARPRPPASGGAMPFARKYTTVMPYDSRPCDSMAEATPPRAVSPSACLTSCSALWSVSAENASSQTAHALASD